MRLYGLQTLLVAMRMKNESEGLEQGKAVLELKASAASEAAPRDLDAELRHLQ